MAPLLRLASRVFRIASHPGCDRHDKDIIMRILFVLITSLAAASASAETLFPMPSVPDVTAAEGWAVGLGAGLEYEAEYDGSDEYGVEVEPVLVVQRRQGNSMWFLEGQELGWRGRLDDVWLVQAGLRLEGGREESDAPELEGLGDVDDELMGMLEVRRALGRSWSNWVAGRVMAGGSDIGALGVAAIGHTFAAQREGSGVDLFAFVTFGSSAFINRDFGIDQEQSDGSGLPVTTLGGGYRSAGIQAVGRWRLGERWQLQAEAGYERYNSDIADSPITVDDYEAELGLNLLFRF
jgi:outer membrane scaffolding protein for murein synthesis (MipA/OmpV family)